MKFIKYIILSIIALLFNTASAYTNDERSFLQYALTEDAAVVSFTTEYANSIGLSWAVAGTVAGEPVVIGARKSDNRFVVMWIVPDTKLSHEGVRQMNENPNISFFSFKASETSTACCYITTWQTDVTKENLDTFFGLVRVAINVSKK